MLLKRLLYIGLFIFIGIPSFSQLLDWKLQKDEHGAKIYTRKADGFIIDEIKTEITVKAPMNEVVAAIMDADHYKDWIYKCSESRVIKKVSDTEQYQYQVNDLPLPFSDRDIVIHFKVWQDAATQKVFTNSLADPAYIPEVTGKVRVPVFVGSYELTPQQNGTVAISYWVQIDPGGYIPDWLVNLFIVQGPYESILKLKSRIESGMYHNASVAFLKG